MRTVSLLVFAADGRWDRMIYTIRDCEEYLKSVTPSKQLVFTRYDTKGIAIVRHE